MIRVNGADFPWEENLSVQKLLEKKNFTFPAIIVSINGTVIPEDRYDSTQITDGDDVQVIHLLAGG